MEPSSIFFTILALHIIFIVTWFAGLFYIVRLFVYHTEAEKKSEPERSILQKQFKVMMRRLWYGITWPSAILTLVLGPLTWFTSPFSYIETMPASFLLKMVFVVGLVMYHLKCHLIYSELQRNHHRHSSMFLRVWNEIASVILIAVVFLIVLKKDTALIWWTLAIVVTAVALYIGIQVYRKNREDQENKDKDNDQIPPPPDNPQQIPPVPPVNPPGGNIPA